MRSKSLRENANTTERRNSHLWILITNTTVSAYCRHHCEGAVSAYCRQHTAATTVKACRQIYPMYAISIFAANYWISGKFVFFWLDLLARINKKLTSGSHCLLKVASTIVKGRSSDICPLYKRKSSCFTWMVSLSLWLVSRIVHGLPLKVDIPSVGSLQSTSRSESGLEKNPETHKLGIESGSPGPKPNVP